MQRDVGDRPHHIKAKQRKEIIIGNIQIAAEYLDEVFQPDKWRGIAAEVFGAEVLQRNDDLIELRQKADDQHNHQRGQNKQPRDAAGAYPLPKALPHRRFF
jgi:hypothetical protein